MDNDKGVMTAEEARAYKARWEAVNQVEAQERLSSSLALRWQQLNALYGLAHALGVLKPESSDDVLNARRNWLRLYQLHLKSVRDDS